jgi:membrane protein required for beta-lactamase induction
MKHANVLSTRDVAPADSGLARYGDYQKRHQMEALLRRYPETSERETEEIIRFLATGNHLDVGLVSGSDEFKEKVARFRAEHSSHFRLKFREAMLFLFLVGGPVAAMAWRYLG